MTWRSHPGHRQPRSRVRNARRVGAETTRVARPTSITIESASSTRDMVQSQAMRSSVRVEIGSESSRSAGGAPSYADLCPSAFTPSACNCSVCTMTSCLSVEQRAYPTRVPFTPPVFPITPHHRNDTWNTLTEQLDQHPRSQDQVFRWPIVLRNSGLLYLVLLA